MYFLSLGNFNFFPTCCWIPGLSDSLSECPDSSFLLYKKWAGLYLFRLILQLDVNLGHFSPLWRSSESLHSYSSRSIHSMLHKASATHLHSLWITDPISSDDPIVSWFFLKYLHSHLKGLYFPLLPLLLSACLSSMCAPYSPHLQH